MCKVYSNCTLLQRQLLPPPRRPHPDRQHSQHHQHIHTCTSQKKQNIFTRCSLPISQCKGQGYNGTSTMMGYLSGVATQLRKEEPSAIPVHCFAHCLNLCLQDAAKVCTMVRDSLGLIGEISQPINYSPKCSFIYSKCKDELCPHACKRP